MIINISKYGEREVSLIKNLDHFAIFKIGASLASYDKTKGEVIWGIMKKGYNYKDLYGKVMTLYIKEWIKAADASGKRPFAMATNPTPEALLDSAKPNYELSNNSLSGVALWMKEGKIWTPCYSRKEESKGEILYWRRTRFFNENDPEYNEGFIELVKEFRPFCYKCLYREKCKQPCTNKEIKSEEALI